MTKRILFILIFLILFAIKAIAFDNEVTHPDITANAVTEANMETYLIQNLGFTRGIETKLSSNSEQTILYWLKKGSTDEDNLPCRASNHFHNPLLPWGQSYMSDEPIWLNAKCFSWSPWYSNITWATGYLSQPPLNPVSGYPDAPKASFTTDPDKTPINWDRARDYYFKALTSSSNSARDLNFASTFQAVGQVMHLLQDVAVPAHVRNDFKSHLAFSGFNTSNFMKWFGNPFEYYVQNHSEVIAAVTDDTIKRPSFANPRLTDFWDTDQYTGNNPSAGLPIGLAEFTNANYLSDSTIPYTIRTQNHTFTYPRIDDSNIQVCYDYAPGSTRKRAYLSRKDHGPCPPVTEARTADHFVAISLLGNFSIKSLTQSVLGGDYTSLINTVNPLTLDENVHKTYAGDLLPRAVGYSAGLLNYFFRGILEISAPSSYVYSITDGSRTPFTDVNQERHQQFTAIKAKVKNTTPNEAMTEGTLQAVAKYKIVPNYAPDLSSYPPDGTTMHGIGYSYSVSAPRTLLSEELVSMNVNPTEFTFDFTADPIPAGITDLYLQIVFKGTLGNERDIAVAVGMKDLMEPTHHVFWNLTDMVSLYIPTDNAFHLYTADQIRSDPALSTLAAGAYIDPHDIDFEFAYMAESPPINPITTLATAVLPTGRHVRLICLSDRQDNNYVRSSWSSAPYPNVRHRDLLFQAAQYEEFDGLWHFTPVTTYRTANGHLNEGVIVCKPDSGICPYPQEEAVVPADLTPYQATINFP